MVLFAFAAISSYLPGLSAQHSRRWHPRRVRSQNQRSCRTRSWEIQISLRTMILESKAQRRNPMICSLILLIRSSTYWTPQKLPAQYIGVSNETPYGVMQFVHAAKLDGLPKIMSI
uniref:Uncharacterized protein n=1 Tax=Aegilops tauschii subsp. strangulata TaxID=200361 RepID=A0A453T046_AEGTS